MKKRVAWVDYAKGIAIILVFWGHTTCPESFRPFFYAFHVPLFFWLSGYVFSIKKYPDFKSFFWKKCRTLILPGAGFLLFSSVIESIIDYASGLAVSFNPIKWFIGIFIEMRGSEYTGVPWFFFCLFVVELTMYFMLHVTQSIKLLLVFSGICSILGYLYAAYISHILPWTVDVAISAIFFFILGYAGKIYHDKLLTILAVPFIPVWALLTWALSYANVYFSGTGLDMYSNTYGWYIFAFGGAIAGILFVLSMMSNLEKWGHCSLVKRILSSVGQNTFILYALNGVALRLSEIIVSTFDSSVLLNGIVSIIVVILAILLCYPITIIINRYFPFILGR